MRALTFACARRMVASRDGQQGSAGQALRVQRAQGVEGSGRHRKLATEIFASMVRAPPLRTQGTLGLRGVRLRIELRGPQARAGHPRPAEAEAST